jgi:hypothetical protein
MSAMIVAMHIATGAAAGALTGSRLGAVVLGPVLHAAADRIPHEDIDSRGFEVRCGVLGVVALAAVRGVLDPATVGAFASAAPDIEHVVRLPRPGGRKLFPSHRPGFTRPGGVPASVQLIVAGLLLGIVLGAGLRNDRHGSRRSKGGERDDDVRAVDGPEAEAGHL